jgi:hypothetical protein
VYYLPENKPMLLKIPSRLGVLLLVLTACVHGQAIPVRIDDSRNASALSNRVAQFEVADATIIDAMSKLSEEPIPGLHLGIEEIIQDSPSKPTDRSVRFSVHLHDVTVREIM